MKVPAPSLAPILRSDVQGRLLARLFADPSRSHTLSALAQWADSSLPTVQREVNRAERAGIVITEKVGPSRLVRSNPTHPLFTPLSQILLSTYGAPVIVAEEFAEVDGADAVLLFGSWAARYDGQPGQAPNDIDVLVIGTPDRDAVDEAAERSERRIGVPVQATVRSRHDWFRANDPFIREVRSRPVVVVLAGEDIADEMADSGSGEVTQE